MTKRYLLFSIFLFLFSPFCVFAINDVSIVCDSTRLAIGDETTCSLVANNLNFTAVDVTGKVSVGSNLSIINSSYDNGVWMSLDSIFSVTDINLMRQSNTFASNLTIATFRIKANNNIDGNSYIRFTNVAIGNSNYDSVPLNCNPVNFTFKSNINTLSSLVVDGKSINFSSDKTTYSIDVDEPSINISAIATDPSAIISGIGTINLNYGKNTINVVVTAESGAVKTYTINVNRKDNRSSNNNLKSLSLSVGKLSFNKNTTVYNVDVDSKTTSIKIDASLEDNKSSFLPGYEPRTVNLEYGTNTFLIKVLSEKGQEKIYTININRKDDRRSNNDLKSLSLSQGKIKFNKNTTSYIVNVSYEVETIEITAKASDKLSNVEILGDTNLKVGNNEFEIRVTAENGSVKVYKLLIIRDEKVEITVSNKASLIEVEGYDIDFDQNQYSYTVKTNEKKLNIKVVPVDENATYKIIGNENLKEGSIISIIITDVDGNSNIYKINIENLDSSNKINFNIITIILLIISLMCNILLIVMNLRKKQKNFK